MLQLRVKTLAVSAHPLQMLRLPVQTLPVSALLPQRPLLRVQPLQQRFADPMLHPLPLTPLLLPRLRTL